MSNNSRTIKQIFRIGVVLAAGLLAGTQAPYYSPFFEDFTDSTSQHFEYRPGGNGADFTVQPGARSLTEPGNKVLLMKIDPQGPPGAGRGPEIISKTFTHFGSYAARLKVPDVRTTQPNVGAVVGYFTYHMDSLQGLSEIDFEWLIADPEVIYIGTWTGPRGALKRIGRTINLATGIIYRTAYREGHQGESTPLTGVQNEPDSITAVQGYDASSRFYTYGFDWHSDRVRWWMIHPVTADTVVLWNYHGSMVGIPPNQTHYRLNFWYTNEWAVITNPAAIERPHHPYELEVDWMSYDPVTD